MTWPIVFLFALGVTVICLMVRMILAVIDLRRFEG